MTVEEIVCWWNDKDGCEKSHKVTEAQSANTSPRNAYVQEIRHGQRNHEPGSGFLMRGLDFRID